MSRAYHMAVEIQDFNLAKYDAIIEAAGEEWEFDSDNWYSNPDGNYISNDANGRLCGGESEEDFATRLALAVWKANGKFCEVQVVATYMESLPCETHVRTQEDFDAAGFNPCTSCGKLLMALEAVEKKDGRLLCVDCSTN